MKFESQPLREKSEKELLEEEKVSILEQLKDLDAIDKNFLETEDVRLESEILLVKEKLADYFSGGFTKEEYDPTGFSLEEQVIINRLLLQKKEFIEDRKNVRNFLVRDKEEMQSELLDQLADIQSKLKNL